MGLHERPIHNLIQVEHSLLQTNHRPLLGSDFQYIPEPTLEGVPSEEQTLYWLAGLPTAAGVRGFLQAGVAAFHGFIPPQQQRFNSCPHNNGLGFPPQLWFEHSDIPAVHNP